MILLLLAGVVSSGFSCASCAHGEDSQTNVPAKRYIRSIKINIDPIFEDPEAGILYSVANQVKSKTQEDVVRRELLFAEGEEYNEFLLRETERNLRLQKFLRGIKITPTFDGDAVDIVVQTQDTWTLIPFASYSSGTGHKNRGIGLAESDLFGYGKRLETRYQEDESRKSYAVVYDDRQLLGTKKGMTLAAFQRSDGDIFRLSLEDPFRSLLQKDAWSFDTNYGNTVGRLFRSGQEYYIFRQQNEDYSAFYTIAGSGRKYVGDEKEDYSGIYRGVPILNSRFSVGYQYISDQFERADRSDYEDLNLDPRIVSNDPSKLAQNRRFSGPVLRYQTIHPNYISMNYIDRFDRVEDYNLGLESLYSLHIAPRMFGSNGDNFIFTGNKSRGWAFSDDEFLRGEVGLSTRLNDGTSENTLLRGELKYYDVLGNVFYHGWFLGRHTLAASAYFDLGEDLDRDRQFLVGADNALRGYEANTFEGDKRLAINLEERTHLADDVLQLISVGAAIFFDAGGASRDSLGTILADDLYSDVGFGFRFGFPRSSGGGVIRMDVAFPLRDGPDGTGAFEPRIIFAAGQLFGSRLRSEVVGAENATVGAGFDR